MWTNYVTLHNIGPFAHYETELVQGLIGIIGRNGQGKTTLVNSIYAAMTNDWSRFVGVKADQIHDLAELDEESFVEIECEHDGQPFTLRRNLRPNKAKLSIPGEQTITKVPEIQARLEQDLGVDAKLIDTYVFVDQGELFAFLEHTPAVRAEAYKHLCRTGQSNTIHSVLDALGERYRDDGEFLDNSDELATELVRKEQEIHGYDEAREAQEKLLLNERSKSSADTIVKKRERYVQLSEELEAAEETRDQRKDRRDKGNEALDAAEIALEDARKGVAKLKSSAEEARAALKSWTTYEKRRKRKDKLNAEAESLLEEPMKNPEPKPENANDATTRGKLLMRNLRAETQQKLDMADEVIATYEESGEGKCPTCHQEIDEKFVLRMREEQKRAKAQLKALKPKIEAVEEYEEKLQEWKEWKADFDARLKANGEELKAFGELEEPDSDKSELEDAVSSYDEAVETEDEAEEAYNTAKDNATRYVTKHSESVKRCAEIEKGLKDNEVADQKYDKAKRRLDEHRAAELQIERLDALSESAHKEIRRITKEADALRAQLDRRKKVRRALKVVDAAKDAFHWSKLPQLVAQGNLVFLEEGINEVLHWFNDPFWAEAGEDLGFLIHQPGHPPGPAEALSGGQKGVFAVAMRCAVADLFGADIGMMFLDEPTANMDEANVDAFGEVLGRLAAEVRGKRQLAIVTHAQPLRSAFDQVIEVSRDV